MVRPVLQDKNQQMDKELLPYIRPSIGVGPMKNRKIGVRS